MAFLVPVVLGALLFAVSFDVQQSNHQFANSFSGRKLKEFGGYEYGLIVFEQVSLVSNVTTKWVKNVLPVYLNNSADLINPWIKMVKELSLVSYNIGCNVANNISTYITNKYPVAEYWYLYYFGFCFLPGPIAGVVQGHSLIVHMKSLFPTKQVQQNLPVVRESFYSFWNVTKHGANIAYDVARAKGIDAAEYINKKGWVWTELQKYTQTAINTTQTLASNTISWAYSAIQSYTDQKR